MQLSKEEYARKRIHNGSSVQIENSVTRVTVRHHSASLVMPNGISLTAAFFSAPISYSKQDQFDAKWLHKSLFSDVRVEEPVED